MSSNMYRPSSDLKLIFSRLSEIDAERVSAGLDDPVNSEWSLLTATDISSKGRNRYSNVLAWEKSRVKLPIRDQFSDYINASYVKLDGKLRYIACQGPLNKTVHHFWSMCYNESEIQATDSVLIVMVTPLIENGVFKCSQYWPDEQVPSFDLSSLISSDGIDIPGLKVNYVSSTNYDENSFTLNMFELISANKKKVVYHIHYHNWPDSDMPSSAAPLFSLSSLVKNIQDKEEKELIPIVHCSAGVGRTGTFIVFDHLINNRISKDVKEPVLNTVIQLRSCRMLMVQTFRQFKFLYDFAKQYLQQ